MNHLDTVLFSRPEVDFLDYVLEFLRSPENAAHFAPERVFEPHCESLLTKLAFKARLRGI